MTITAITYHCPTSSMGDNVTESDAEGYRAWIKAELEREFPGADVTVTDEQRTNNIQTDADADDVHAWDAVHQFVHACWDRCDWQWVEAA